MSDKHMSERERNSIKLHLFNTSWFTKEGHLDWRQIVGKTILLILFFLIVYAIGLYFVRDRYHEIGEWVGNHLGLPGIALFVFITDMFIMPLSVDIVFPFVLQWPIVSLLLTMSIASAVGGYGGYWIGRLLGRLKFIRQFTSSFNNDGERLINKFGVWGIVIAGITPIPFSTVCWMTGMLRVNHWLVALATLSRLPRMIIYYAIFRGGLSFLF